MSYDCFYSFQLSKNLICFPGVFEYKAHFFTAASPFEFWSNFQYPELCVIEITFGRSTATAFKGITCSLKMLGKIIFIPIFTLRLCLCK